MVSIGCCDRIDFIFFLLGTLKAQTSDPGSKSVDQDPVF